MWSWTRHGWTRLHLRILLLDRLATEYPLVLLFAWYYFLYSLGPLLAGVLLWLAFIPLTGVLQHWMTRYFQRKPGSFLPSSLRAAGCFLPVASLGGLRAGGWLTYQGAQVDVHIVQVAWIWFCAGCFSALFSRTMLSSLPPQQAPLACRDVMVIEALHRWRHSRKQAGRREARH